MQRAVVIGQGSIGNRHAALFQEVLGEQVLHLPAGLRENSPTDSILEKTLAFDPTHVVIATPAHLHWSFIEPLLEKGIRVLCEKPLVASRIELSKITKAFEDDKLENLWVGYNLQYRPEFECLVSNYPNFGSLLWAQFSVGQHLSQWRPGRALASTASLNAQWGGGALLELSHELDMALLLLGDIELQYAATQNGMFSNGVEESAQLMLKKGAASIQVSLDFHRPEPERTIYLAFENGFMNADFISKTVSVTREGETEAHSFGSVDTYQQQRDAFLDDHQHFSRERLVSALRAVSLALEAKAFAHG